VSARAVPVNVAVPLASYAAAVTEARTLVKRSEADQWRLAELTWQQVEAGKSRRQWAKDIGVSHTHAERLYIVWSTWSGNQVATRPLFAEAYNFSKLPETEPKDDWVPPTPADPERVAEVEARWRRMREEAAWRVPRFRIINPPSTLARDCLAAIKNAGELVDQAIAAHQLSPEARRFVIRKLQEIAARLEVDAA
jgi:hypothetical protein